MRHSLYFALGFLPSIFFALRFLIQWIRSEKVKTSHVDSLFWKLSLAGNLLLTCHYFIQSQYPFLMIQAINGFVAWRNLNILKHERRVTLKRSLIILGATLFIVTSCFVIQKIIFLKNAHWFDLPAGLKIQQEIPLLWHVLGIGGSLIFATRFWIQWIELEKTGKSTLNPYFWVLSIIGSLLALIYFVRIMDTVSIINTAFGFIPYVRNLILLKGKRT